MSSANENIIVTKNRRLFIWLGILMILIGGLTIFGLFFPFFINTTDPLISFWSGFALEAVIVLITGMMVFIAKRLEQNIDDQYFIDFYSILRVMFLTKLILIIIFFSMGWDIASIDLILRILNIFFTVILYIIELIVWFRLFNFFRKVKGFTIISRVSGITGSVFLFIGPLLILIFVLLVRNNIITGTNGFLVILIMVLIYVVGYIVAGFSLIFTPKSVLEQITLKMQEHEEIQENILEVKNLTKVYSSGIIRVSKVIGAHNVNFNLKRGEILSIVGESGSGKSTVANMILQLLDSTEGEIMLNGIPIKDYSMRQYYNKVQAIFQDPYGSFNQFFKIDRVLEEAYKMHIEKELKTNKREGKRNIREEKSMFKNSMKAKIDEVLHKIGLNPEEVLGRYPHQLSGGQLQRFLLARVLILEPVLLIADEMTSMIDASSRAGILNLLEQLKEFMSVLFITHDIGQAQYISNNIIVMEKGNVVEKGPVSEVLTNPQHEYTKELLKAVPTIEERWDFLKPLSKKKAT